MTTINVTSDVDRGPRTEFLRRLERVLNCSCEDAAPQELPPGESPSGTAPLVEPGPGPMSPESAVEFAEAIFSDEVQRNAKAVYSALADALLNAVERTAGDEAERDSRFTEVEERLCKREALSVSELLTDVEGWLSKLEDYTQDLAATQRSLDARLEAQEREIHQIRAMVQQRERFLEKF